MADIKLKDEKRISVNGEYDLVTTHPNNEPIYRSNGHELDLVATNSDFISTQFSNTTITETSDIDLEFEFYLDSFSGGRIRLFHFSDENGEAINNSKAFWFETSTPRNQLLFRQSNSDGSVNANAKDLGAPIIGVNKVKILNGEAFLNGVKTSSDPNNYTLDISNPYLKIARFYNSSQFTDVTLLGFKVQGESFNPTNINSLAQIEGSNGTIAQVNSSAADPINYILGTVFQKSGFALVGNGSTQKIVSPLGGEIILTSTPLEGGFDLDGKTYNLTEGLGNVIKSTDGTTECDIVGFSGTSLNFGGWQKGDNINGWNPYTV